MKTSVRNRTKTVTIGIDLGERKHTFCVLDAYGEVVERGSMPNARRELEGFARRYPSATVVINRPAKVGGALVAAREQGCDP
jgi:hypothetical protein